MDHKTNPSTDSALCFEEYQDCFGEPREVMKKAFALLTLWRPSSFQPHGRFQTRLDSRNGTLPRLWHSRAPAFT
jgi:hypothetical protein